MAKLSDGSEENLTAEAGLTFVASYSEQVINEKKEGENPAYTLQSGLPQDVTVTMEYLGDMPLAEGLAKILTAAIAVRQRPSAAPPEPDPGPSRL